MNWETKYSIFKFKHDTIKSCDDAFKKTEIGWFKIGDLLKEIGKSEYSPLSTSKIYDLKTLDEVSTWHKNFLDAMLEARRKLNEKELAEAQKSADEKIKKAREKTLAETLKEIDEDIKQKKEEAESLSGKVDETIKEEPKRNDSPKTPNNPDQPRSPDKPREESSDEKCKREYIEETERMLKEHNISDAKLSQRLGVSDWKAEMNKSSGWRTAQTFSFSINKAIEKMSKEIVCDMCKETASPILDYIEFDKKEGKKKKFCSWECQNSWKDKNKGINKDDAKEIKKELQEIKDFLKKNNENVTRTLTNLLTWMKKGGVIKVTLSDDKLVVELSGKKTKTIEESNLTSEQRVLKNYLQSNPEKKTINKSELEEMVSGNYNQERERNNKKNGNAGIIGAIIVVGIIFAVIIGVVIHKNKKRDY